MSKNKDNKDSKDSKDSKDDNIDNIDETLLNIDPSTFNFKNEDECKDIFGKYNDLYTKLSIKCIELEKKRDRIIKILEFLYGEYTKKFKKDNDNMSNELDSSEDKIDNEEEEENPIEPEPEPEPEPELVNTKKSSAKKASKTQVKNTPIKKKPAKKIVSNKKTTNIPELLNKSESSDEEISNDTSNISNNISDDFTEDIVKKGTDVNEKNAKNSDEQPKKTVKKISKKNTNKALSNGKKKRVIKKA